MLRFEKVTKKYGSLAAVTEVDLQLEEGVYGFLSPNGAGKTTLLKMAATLLTPSEGTVTWDGTDIFQMGEKYRGMLGYMPQHFGYYRDYSAEKFLSYLAVLKGMDRNAAGDKISRLLDMVGLEKVKKKKLRTYSGGMLQRVGIAQAMLNEPRILILDEPTAGLDPRERARLREMLADFSRGRIVLYSTHIVSDLENLANRIILLKDGRLFANAPARQLCQSLEGKVWSASIDEDGYEDFAKKHLIMSVRQEGDKKMVRFIAEGEPRPAWTAEYPGLEDVFLSVYEEEARDGFQ